jgi:hypothetical protein
MTLDAFDLTISDSFRTPGRRKNNWAGVGVPSVTDDEDAGYEVGSVWFDTTGPTWYDLADATGGAAVWVERASSVGGGADLDWFVVTDYGATGDGTTDDRDAINDAIAAYNAAGGGVLYFPHPTDFYFIDGTSALDAINAPGLVLGDGGALWESASEIRPDGDLFEVTAKGVEFRGLYMNGTTGTAIVSSDSWWLRVVDCNLYGFDTGLDLEESAFWRAEGSYIYGRDYCIRVLNTANPDFGDWSVTNCTLTPSTGATAIRVDSSGGGRIIGNKINANDSVGARGIDIALATGIETSVLLIQGNSIENIPTEGVRVTLTGTARYCQIIIDGNQFGLWDNTAGECIEMVSAATGSFASDDGIYGVVISNNVFMALSNAGSAVDLTKVDNARFSGNLTLGFASEYTATTCTNIVDDASGAGAPTTVDYLVGTASGSLSAEIVVGTSPGGELGGTWASPTVDATHSGSTHDAATNTHIADTSAAHAASAVSFSPTGSIAATDVQAAIAEVASESSFSEAAVRDAGHWEVVVSGSAPPVAVSTPSDDDWVYAWVPG